MYDPKNFPSKEEGLPILNTSFPNERNLSDPNWNYHDDKDNTSQVYNSSSNNLYETEKPAIFRSSQIGCTGAHQSNINGKTFWLPCLTDEKMNERLDAIRNGIYFTYVGNSRIVSFKDPFKYVTAFNGLILDVIRPTYTSSGSPLINTDIKLEYRWSIDNERWSLWTEITDYSITNNTFTNSTKILDLNPNDPFYPEIRFTAVLRNNDGSINYTPGDITDPNLVIVNVDFDLTYDTELSDNTNKIYAKPALICSDEKSIRPVVFKDNCGPLTFKPYDVNRSMNLYKDLSKMVNQTFGWDVNYYSIQPHGRGKDVFMKEYTIFNCVDEKCIKIMVPQNQFPDNKINYDPFGLQFETNFEVHIDKGYFENYFGKGSQPRKRDVIYIPLMNRIYQINTTYLFRDFMYSPVYFKLELVKYEPKANTYFEDPSLQEELEGISLDQTKLFGEENTNSENKATKEEQYLRTTQRRWEDPSRSYIFNNLSIIGYDINNNWTIISNNYYDLDSSFYTDSNYPYDSGFQKTAVIYKDLPALGEKEELGFTSWFSIKNFIDQSTYSKSTKPIFPITIVNSDINEITFSTYPMSHKLVIGDNPNGFVGITGDNYRSGGFPIKSIPDLYTFKVSNINQPIIGGTHGWKCQAAQSRNLLYGRYFENSIEKGISIDIIHTGIDESSENSFLNNGSIRIRLNDLDILSSIQTPLSYNSFYGIVVNVSNLYKQLSINLWEIQSDIINPSDNSGLKMIHQEIIPILPQVFNAPSDKNIDMNSPFYGSDNNSYKLLTSPMYITNLRLFKEMVETDRQSNVLNQNIVRDSQLLHLLDNAKPILKNPKIGKNR